MDSRKYGKESEIVMGEIIPFAAKGHEKRRIYASQSHLARNVREDETVRNYLHFLEEIEHMLHEVMDGQVRTVLETCIQISGGQRAGTVNLCFQQLDFRSSHKIISKLQEEGWRTLKTIPAGYLVRMPHVHQEKQEQAEKFLLQTLEKAVRDLAWSDSVFNQEVNQVLEDIESIRD